MAKARARTATRKVKDKWKAKNWYQILAPSLFDHIPISETLAENPDYLIGRVNELTLQDLTNDFRKSHIKIFLKIDKVEDGKAHTYFKGHALKSDYLRRMIRRRKSRIDGVYDVETKDGAYLRVKPFAITDKRIQNSQKKLIRGVMKETITKEGKAKTLNEFLRDMLEGKLGSEIYKHCKTYYPVKRVEIHKTEVMRTPTIVIEEKKPVKKEEVKEEPKEEKEPKKKATKEKETKKAKEETTEKPKPSDEKKTPKKKKATKKSTTTKKTKAKPKTTKKATKTAKSKTKKTTKKTK